LSRRVGAPAWSTWLGAVAAVVGLQAGSFAVMPAIGPPPLASFLVGFGCVAGAAIGVGAVAPAPRARWALALVFPAACLGAVAAVGPRPSGPLWVGLVTAALLGGGTLAGGLVGGRVQRPGHLMVVAYVSSLADLYSVFAPSGPSAQVVDSERALAVLALSWPLPTGPHGVEAMPLLGVGDVIMTAVYLAASRGLDLGRVRTAVALAFGYAVVVGTLLWRGEAVPALPMLGLAIVLAHPRARHLPRTEWRTALLGVAAVTATFCALWMLR
jgi:hypothetical protein